MGSEGASGEAATGERRRPSADGRPSGAWWVALAVALLVVTPLLLTRTPPISDLAQQLAQIRLFGDAFSNPASAYRIQWTTPYSLVYLILGADWLLRGPMRAGPLSMAVLAVLWAGAVHLLACRRQRALAAAVLASLLVFNHAFYWGFLSFLIGWPSFALWFLLVTREPRCYRGHREGLLYVGGALLLYLSHALWLGAGLAFMALVAILHRVPLTVSLRRLAWLSPIIVQTAVWFSGLATPAFDSLTQWHTLPWERLQLPWLRAALLGGLRSPLELVLLALVAAWLAGGLWQHRHELGRAVDRDLLAAGALLLMFGLFLPELYTNTLYFARRWMPHAGALLVLALPPPRAGRRWHLPVALGALIVLVATTVAAWHYFDEVELAGLDESLAAIPYHQRVLGLTYIDESLVIRDHPFIHMYAYAQVRKDAQLQFSFAQGGPLLVVLREWRPEPRTQHLEWSPEKVRVGDFAYFDYVVVSGDEAIHRQMGPPLVAVTQTYPWRLYRVEH